MSENLTPGPSFADVLNQLMASRGLNQHQLAVALGTWDGNVGRWRRGAGIEIANVYRLADYFNVDRQYLARLAGYPDNHMVRASDRTRHVAHDLAVLADAERAAFLKELDDIPPPFWMAIMAAQHAARSMAVAAARTALELAGYAHPKDAISTRRNGELAGASRSKRKKDQGNTGPANTPLASLFPPASPVLALR